MLIGHKDFIKNSQLMSGSKIICAAKQVQRRNRKNGHLAC